VRGNGSICAKMATQTSSPEYSVLFTCTQKVLMHACSQCSYFAGNKITVPGVKQQGSGVNHQPPFSAEVKKVHRFTSAPSLCLMAAYRVNIFTFTQLLQIFKTNRRKIIKLGLIHNFTFLISS
jgi:hypothetical protein